MTFFVFVSVAAILLDNELKFYRIHRFFPSPYTHTHPFNGPLFGTTRVSQYQKGKTNLDFTEARDSEWQWHQPGRMQVCTSLQTDITRPAPHHIVFYRPDARDGTGSHLVTRESRDPVDPVTLFYNELQMLTYV